jgi:hypothetical protein
VHLLANGQPGQATLAGDEDMKHTWPSNEEEEKDPKDGIDWIFRIHGGWAFLKALREQLSWGVDTCGCLCFVCFLLAKSSESCFFFVAIGDECSVKRVRRTPVQYFVYTTRMLAPGLHP